MATIKRKAPSFDHVLLDKMLRTLDFRGGIREKIEFVVEIRDPIKEYVSDLSDMQLDQLLQIVAVDHKGQKEQLGLLLKWINKSEAERKETFREIRDTLKKEHPSLGN